jgi:CheY-like chemotaxis protein
VAGFSAESSAILIRITIPFRLKEDVQRAGLLNMNRPKLLLAEDSAHDVFFFERAVKRSGVECTLKHVSDGAAAIEVLREGVAGPAGLPDLVFLDLKMPVMSGFEVLEWLREQSYRSSVPVIVLSGSDQKSDRERAVSLGATAYLVKPISAETLSACLRQLCGADNTKTSI